MEVKYAALYCVVELKEAFLLYTEENYALIFPMNRITQGTSEELGDLFREKLGKKFIPLH
jgi:hypothetical protein